MRLQRMHMARSERGSGAPELLVTALVVLILFIAASPFYRAAKAEAARLRCEEARGLLAEAQIRFRKDSSNHKFTLRLEDLHDLVPRLPECAEGGRFRFRISDPGDKDSYGKPIEPNRLIILCSYWLHKPIVVPNQD